MALDELLGDIIDPGSLPVGDIPGDLPIDELIDPGSLPVGSIPGPGGNDMDGLLSWLRANPTMASALLGGAGPLASLLGTLSSGGRGATNTGSMNQNTVGNVTQNQAGTQNTLQNTSGLSQIDNTRNTQQSGTQNSSLSGTQTGQQSGTTSSQQSGQGTTSGTTQQTGTGSNTTYGTQTGQQTLDPQAQMAMDRLTAQLGGNAGDAQGAYTQGLSMLRALASGQGATGQGGASNLPGPNTTPSPAPVTGFPTAPPTTYNPALGNLIKQAFGSFTGDIANSAITNARNRGFAGGADLLQTAAAPIAGQALAQVPAMEAKAYLDHVLQAYGLESENAGRKAGAEAGALNAATNALGPGVSKYGMDVQKYGIDRNADNNQLANMTSLLTALMGPQQQMMQGNLGLLNAAPRGTTQTSLGGGTNTQSLSGATTGTSQNTQNNTGQSNQTSNQTSNQVGSQTNNQNTNQQESQTGATSGTTGTNTLSNNTSNTLSNQNVSGNTTGTTSTPLGTVIGTGIGDVGRGVATGIAAQEARNQQAAQNQSLLTLLARMGRG